MGSGFQSRSHSVGDGQVLEQHRGCIPGPNGLLVEALPREIQSLTPGTCWPLNPAIGWNCPPGCPRIWRCFTTCTLTCARWLRGAQVWSARRFPHLVAQSAFENALHARTYGAELSTNLRLASWWRLSPSYSWWKMVVPSDIASTDAGTAASLVHRSPRHQFQIRSYLDLPLRLQVDTSVYSVSSCLRCIFRPAFAPAHGWGGAPVRTWSSALRVRTC